jgi:hypothetical protein
MIRAADRFLAVTDAQTRIVPGHGPVSSRADLVATRGFLIVIRDRIRDVIAKG